MIRILSMTYGCSNWFMKPYGLSLWWFTKLSLLQPLTDSGPETEFLSGVITQNHYSQDGRSYMAVLTILSTHMVDGITSIVRFSHACPSSSLHTKRGLFQLDMGGIQTLHQPPKGPVQASFLILLKLMLGLSAPAKEVNPHIPFKLTWVIEDGESYKTLYQTTHVAPLKTWWPDLHFWFWDLNHVYRATGQVDDRRHVFYKFPGYIRNSKQCRSLESFLQKLGLCHL